MNTEQANGISLREILLKIGYAPAEKKGYDLMYFSPFRDEKTPSFHLQAAKNIWYDFGEGQGGTVIDFICAWLKCHDEDHNVTDALRWISNMYPKLVCEVVSREEGQDYEAPTLELRKVETLQNTSLLKYLSSRGIPGNLAKKYFREVTVRNQKTGKTFFTLGWPNENGGYELRNKFFKGSVHAKCISFIRGKVLMPEEVHVFEGYLDYLSALVQQNGEGFDGDVIVLNSVSLLPHAYPYIRNYSYKVIHTWFDNDEGGEKAGELVKKLAEKESLSHQPMNGLYEGEKDVNAWHMKKLEL